MTDIFLVRGYIEDGMSGQPIILGIFNDHLGLMQTHKCQYEAYGEGYSATYTDKEGYYTHFSLTTEKYAMNEMRTPNFMRSD